MGRLEMDEFSVRSYATFDYFSDKGLESIEASIQARKTDGKFFVSPVKFYDTI